MNEIHESQGFWWDVLKNVSNVVAMAAAAGFGWLMKKFTDVNKRVDKTNERMDSMEKQFTARDHAAETQIAVLQSYHESNIRRLDSIEDTANRIDGKLDDLIASLRGKP